MGSSFENKKNICAKFHLRGWASGPQALAPPPPLVAVGRLVGPTQLCRPQPQVYKFTFVPEKIKREDFVAFAIRRRRHNLFFI